MKKIFIYFTAVLVAGAAFSCKEEIPYANTAGKGLNSISAMFATGEHKTTQDAVFTTVIDPTQEEIFVIIPWYYPFDSFNQTSAEEIRLTADIDAGCTISPSLGGIHNLADKFYFTFTNKNGVKTRHYITGERRYLDLKDILEFRVDSHDLDGVIDNENHTVTLLATEEIINATAVVSISPHATISPDPATPRSYEDPVQFTVTAHDGSTAIFTVKKGIPSRIPAGYRPGSEKLMWAKKLNDDLGITGNNQTTGIAVTKDHIVLNTGNEPSVYIDRKTGDKVGTKNLGPDVTGLSVNHYNTADDDGNILINNLVEAAPGTFKVWKLADVTGTDLPEPFIEYTTTTQLLGRKLSVKGSVDKNAIITVGLNNPMSSTFARWKVTNGILESQTPEFVTITDGYVWSHQHVDIIYSSATNERADYFIASYTGEYNTAAWVNGATNTVRAMMPNMNNSFVPNAIDHIVFNNRPYILYNLINGQTWGQADQIMLAEANNPAGFPGTYAPNPAGYPAVGGGIVWMQPGGVYGSWTLGIQNANYASDVAFKASDDGYYLYVYFMFTNAYVVCYRFDCIQR